MYEKQNQTQTDRRCGAFYWRFDGGRLQGKETPANSPSAAAPAEVGVVLVKPEKVTLTTELSGGLRRP